MTKEIILKYFPDLNNIQKDRFDHLYTLYKEWNTKINVISRKDIDELYLRHVLHSLAIAKFTEFSSDQKILDLGTGGGFPGIPLSIYFPDAEFVLVDSIGKKVKVVEEVIHALQLKNAKCIHDRAEKVKEKFDHVVTRAVAPAKQLWNWSHQLIKPQMDNGIICLKGGDLTDELKDLKRPYQIVEISDYFSESFFETKKIVYIPR